jgi:acyl transferase domain-containing protein
MEDSMERIAIIGMAGRFPGAKSTAQFWENLRNGTESISFFSDEELRAAGISQDVLNGSIYVRARGVLDDVELFDAGFFGINPKEAEITDPQHRLFLELSNTPATIQKSMMN